MKQKRGKVFLFCFVLFGGRGMKKNQTREVPSWGHVYAATQSVRLCPSVCQPARPPARPPAKQAAE